jgi:epidermal growth factor receptor substrate 15
LHDETDIICSDKPAPTAVSPSNLNNLSISNVDDIFGSAVAHQPTPTATASNASRPTTATTTQKGAFDDLDDDFEGLEDAKEGSADDDFANISRSGLEDYNAVFDSSPPPSQPKSDSAKSGAPFGIESSFDFGSLSTTSAANSTAGPASTSGQAKPAAANSQTAEAHDWDALFAGLDEQTPTASSMTLASSGDGNANGSVAKEQTEAAAAAARPNAPGRALTEGGEHDDPILKNLTGMGYSRQDALAALEKYDYNLDRVSMNLNPTAVKKGKRRV